MNTHHVKNSSASRADGSLKAQVVESRYSLLFECVPDGVFIADPDNSYLDANPGMCLMLGFSRAELIGMHASEISSPIEIQYIAPTLSDKETSTDGHRQWQFRRKDGSAFEAEVIATKMPDGNCLGIVRDITTRRQAEITSTRLASIVESSDDAIVGKDLNNTVTSWNPSAEKIFGYTSQEMIGASVLCLIPDRYREDENLKLEKIKYGQKIEHFETVRRTKDGRLIDVSITESPLRNMAGRIIGSSKIMRDVTLVKIREREISRLSRLYAALSQVHQAIVWMPTREELLQKVCRILVEQGGFNMAWIGWYDPATQQILPAADWGDENGYLRKIKLYGDDRPEGNGPTGMAFRTEQPYICNDLQSNPIALPWRHELVKRNFRSSAAFPIREKGKVSGTLTVLADREFFFNNKEIALLEEAAVNISFGLDNLIREHERYQADVFAKNEKQFSDTMIESMPGILYFYTMQGKFLRWNRNFEIVSGYTGDEISSMHPLDFFSGEEKLVVGARIAEVFEKGDSSVEALFIAKNGKATPHFFTGRKAIFNGMECLVGMGIDITQHKQAELRVAESERRYRELVEHANSIILRWNSAGEITFLNEFGQRYFGYTADEIVGRHVMGTIVPCTDSEGHNLQPLMEQICANPAAFEQNINQNIRRNGERVWIAWTNKFVCNAQGDIVEILSIGSDITDRRQAEEMIRELNANLEQRVVERTEALNAALVRAESADRIKSAFLATMSHELRTPLNSIIGFTGIILQGLAGPINPEQTKQLGMVRGSARHLLELINDVLDISKIEAGQLEVRAERFDLRESIERAMALVKPFAEKKGLLLKKSLASDIGEMVNDRRRFEQILINLLNNSIKFTEHGSVMLTVESINDFCLPNASPQPAVCFRITDTGIGIKPEDIKVLFQAFHQVDTGLSRQHEGTGLGLAICRRLSLLMGGDISVRSEWLKGSEFTVILPVHVAAAKS